MKKLGDNTVSPVEKELFDLAGNMSEAQHRKEYAPESGKELEKDTQRRMNELAKPITGEECRIIGVPAVEVADPTQGGPSIQLRNTAKSPNIVNAAAHAERMHLAREVRCTALAADLEETIDPKNSVERDICYQLAAAHSASMKFLAKSQDEMHKSEALSDKDGKPFPPTAAANAARYANISIRLMKAYQDGALALIKMRGGGQQQVTVVHQHVQVDGGNVAVAGNVSGGGGIEKND